MATKILFHSNNGTSHCPDGFAAAYVAWTRFGEGAEYIPCVYQQDAPRIDVDDVVYLVDFSYPCDVLCDMASRASVVVLDHHKTAQAALEGLAFATFDMNRSGAQLAWSYWHANEPEPPLISYVADRDLWRKELPHTEEVFRALQSFPQDFAVWNTLAGLTDYVGFMRRIGAPLYQAHLKAVEELAATATDRNFGGEWRTLSTNTDNYSLVSDALNLVCRQHPEIDFAYNYWTNPEDGSVKYELRSVGDFDVSAVAKLFGGGGHKNAAGCTKKGRYP